MARIRTIEIQHFRGIENLSWCPAPGINCLIGPGDNGKTTVLDAIDMCMGARRSIHFTDADFHRLDVEKPISITMTFGELDDALLNLESYGLYLRGFDSDTGQVADEPGNDLETVLSLRLTVESDLEPVWSLFSERAEAQEQSRNLSWSDRVRLAPARIGALADYHLGWGRGSVLNRLSEEPAAAAAALAAAARDARAAFGDEVQGQLASALGIVAATAQELGVRVGDSVRAMLDAGAVSFGRGTISLHDHDGVPLRGLGVGSMRLLIAGLQRKGSLQASIVLVDELEHGLEPHRIIRFIGALGAKDEVPPLQVFMTTHSPVALRELSGDQLFVTRAQGASHAVQLVGTTDNFQGTIRKYPEAFLGRSVIICEGATEVGMIRGLDLHRVAAGKVALAAFGAALVDCGGGDPDRPYNWGGTFHSLGYMAAVVRDDDRQPTAEKETAFIDAGGKVIVWREGRAIEEELFLSLTDAGVGKLLDRAVELNGAEIVNEQIKSASANAKDLAAVSGELGSGGVTPESRQVLGKAAKSGKGWFKTVTRMEDVARDIVGPDLANADAGFRSSVEELFDWAGNAGH